jgi:hypothetical protein
VSHLIHYAHPQGKLSQPHTVVIVAALNETRRLTTFVRKTYGTRNQVNLSSNHWLWYHYWVTREQPKNHPYWAQSNLLSKLNTTSLLRVLDLWFSHCWICLEISVTRSQKILKNLPAAPGAVNRTKHPFSEASWRAAQMAVSSGFFWLLVTEISRHIQQSFY